MVARGIIGINDWEREKPQEILINIILFTDLQKAGASDDIRDSVNYRSVTKRVLAHAESAQRLTVEALAADLMRICLEEPGVLQARVRVEKPGAVRFSRSVGVEIEWAKVIKSGLEPEKHQACLLLGSNIQPEQNIPLAITYLQKQLTVLRASSLWQSDAMGSSGPDFLNGALLVSTPLDAAALKEQVIYPLEAQLGRVRTSDKNAPRTIDIDIILFDGMLLDPTLWKFAHRSVPVAELLPGYRFESGEYLKDAALRLAHTTHISARKDISIYPGPFVLAEEDTKRLAHEISEVNEMKVTQVFPVKKQVPFEGLYLGQDLLKISKKIGRSVVVLIF